MPQLGSIGPGTILQYRRRRATIGALVHSGGKPYALTVAHIFCVGPRKKSKVEFPKCAGSGWIAACVPLRRLSVHRSDGALVAFDGNVTLAPDHPIVGQLWGYLSAIQVGLSVVFQGPSGRSRGEVVHSSWNGRVRYPWGSRRLSKQVLVEITEGTRPQRGDSGTLWVTMDGLALGLQVATIRKRFAVVSPLGPLLENWNAHLLRSD